MAQQMSTRKQTTLGRHREQQPPPGERARGEERKTGQEEESVDGSSRQSSRCPSCRLEYDIALLLPCSHTLCGRCVAAGEATGSGNSHSGAYGARCSTNQSVCAILCPCCHHLVELPCWEWASATRCLPHDPTRSPGCATREMTTKEEAFEAALQHLQGNTHCRDVKDVTDRSSFYGSTQASSSTAPVDGTIDLREEEMEQSVLGLSFALDSSSGPPCLHLSHSSLIVTFQGEIPDNHIQRVERSTMGSDPQVTLTLPQVCADVVITRGQYYWEVDVCNSTVYRIGVTSLDGATGWWMERRGSSFWAVYDRSQEVLHAVPPQIKTLGVFLNMGGGALSFHNPLTQERLATLPTRFGPTGVLPALGLGQGRLRLHCGLPPPPHVFLSRASAYRRPCGAGGGRWRRDVSFQSVRTVIQRFEELAVSDSDSGLVSSFGSSCSTLVSLSDQGGGVFHSGQGDHEAAAE